MRCDDARARMTALLDGELTERAATDVREHAGGCPACGPALRELEAVGRMARVWEVSGGEVWVAVQRRLHQEPSRSPLHRLRDWWQGQSLAARVACSLGLATGFGFLLVEPVRWIAAMDSPLPSMPGGGPYPGVMLLGLGVIAATVVAILRGVDARLALVLGGAILGFLCGQPGYVGVRFMSILAWPESLVPVCAALGFFFVLRTTGCDRHLQQLVTPALRRAPVQFAVATTLVAFLGSVSLGNGASDAVTVGVVLLPLLLAAGLHPAAAGAALLLGVAAGGSLLNPDARPQSPLPMPVASPAASHPWTSVAMERSPLVLLLLVTACAAFYLAARRRSSFAVADGAAALDEPVPGEASSLKALVPLVPLGALLGVSGLRLCGLQPGHEDPTGGFYVFFPGYLVGAAMVAGSLLAAAADRWQARGVTASFFEGAGHGFANVLLLMAAANAFFAGITLLQLPQLAVNLLLHAGGGTWHSPVVAVVSLLLSALTGSPALGRQVGGLLFSTEATPVPWLGITQGLIDVAAAAGEGLSPAAAVVLACAWLTGTRPIDLIRRVAVPLLAGVAVAALVSVLVLTVR